MNDRGQITGYGLQGPWRDKPGQDLLVQALSGLAWLSGDATDGPVPIGLSIVDVTAGAHLCQAVHAVVQAQQFPRLRDAQLREPAVEATPNDPVVRVVGLEEERLTRGQDTELAGTSGLPEIDLRHPRPVRQEPVPVVIGHPHIRPHNRYCPPPPDLRSGNLAIAAQPANRHCAARGPWPPPGKNGDERDLGPNARSGHPWSTNRRFVLNL